MGLLHVNNTVTHNHGDAPFFVFHPVTTYKQAIPHIQTSVIVQQLERKVSFKRRNGKK